MDVEEDDRISQLPDSIILHILSFVDAKQAVQTTILSTRWQNLWRSISDLNFTFTGFAAHSRINLNAWGDNQNVTDRFADFVSLFLSQRDSAITNRKFRLSFKRCFVDLDPAFVEKCFYYAMGHGVESLHLHLHARWSLRLRFPQGFSACKTLRELKLKQCTYGLVIPKDFSLPHLNTLYLENSVFIDGGDVFTYTKEPFSRMPELEKLTLRLCVTQGLVISAPKLRVLEIVHNWFIFKPIEEISCPMLTSFIYEGCFLLECPKVNVPSLEKFYLNIYVRDRIRNYKRTRPLKCVKMLQQFGNAKFVTLTLDTITVLEMDRRLIEQSPSPFPHIKCLKLTKGRCEYPTAVLKRVMDYLTEGSLCDVEFPEGVVVIDENFEPFYAESSEEEDDVVLGSRGRPL